MLAPFAAADPAPVTGVELNQPADQVIAVEAKFNLTSDQEIAMRELRKLRGDMWDRNVPFDGTTLRQAAAKHGLTSRDAYVNAAQYDAGLSRIALPHLRAAGTGRIVNVASLSGKRVANPNAGYAISKFAVVALTHALRRAGWDDGVRATALCPGFVDTAMTVGAAYPREQMTRPADLAHLAEVLLRLPNTAVVAELLVNCRLEPSL